MATVIETGEDETGAQRRADRALGWTRLASARVSLRRRGPTGRGGRRRSRGRLPRVRRRIVGCRLLAAADSEQKDENDHDDGYAADDPSPIHPRRPSRIRIAGTAGRVLCSQRISHVGHDGLLLCHGETTARSGQGSRGFGAAASPQTRAGRDGQARAGATCCRPTSRVTMAKLARLKAIPVANAGA